MTMQFLVVDDHPLMRKGIRQLLEEAYVSADVQEVDSGEAAVERVRHCAYSLVLLDVSMPGLSGLETLERIARTRPGQRVLMLSMHSENEMALQALRGGASGYVTKDHAADQLLGAIARILGGGRYVSAEFASVLAARFAEGTEGPPHMRLTAREFRVLCMLASGVTPTEIASDLSLSVKTVSTYRARILEKLGVHSNADLTRYALQHGLIQ